MIKESTKALWRVNDGTGWKKPLYFAHAYFYLARSKTYVGTLIPIAIFVFKYFPKKVSFFLLDNFVPNYHGKVIRSEDAKKFVTLDKDLRVDDAAAKKIIPFDVAHKIIIENPDNIVIQDCACRAIHRNCSSAKFGISVCMSIGDPQASFILEHSNLNPKKITVNEALERLEDIHSNGWVHGIWFKDAVGERSYVMCNCCTCCCGAIATHNWISKLGYGQQVMLSSGYVAKTDNEKCKGCLTCVKWCPFEARRINPSTKKSEAIYDKCIGCGVCIDKCPQRALSLELDPKKGIPLDLDKLKEAQA